ncbi:MAG: preprotein translocase subunit SecA [Actinobacteria bacterium]|nr:preprotein translocase subunit SecA [Actinomycetota bacterium]
MSMFDRVLRFGEGRKLKFLESVVPLVNDLEPTVERLSDEELGARTIAFRERLDRGEELDDLLPEAFASVREAAKRTLGQRHFDVQLMGGAALHFGWVAEMKTGEGKTLVSTLPVYLNALAGNGVHVITVNDYLATRDSDWMGRIYRMLGMTVGLVVPGKDREDPAAKRAAYAADITYGTNNEFGFDYLRDNMATSKEAQVQRGHTYAIVDEVDSILIDEARTPLIISGRADDAADLYYEFARITRGLMPERDYEVDEKKRTVVPTEPGIARVEEALGVENLYDDVNQNYVHQLQAALRAKELFHLDKDYVVMDGEVKIVDEFTGRILEGRRWSEGLHQAVEAKENVTIKEENQTLATITLQNYFRMYEKLAGMTGTAMTQAGEFAHVYELECVPIPTNQENVRADQADLIYKSEDAKFKAVTEDIAERHRKGQPILVGTTSVEKSERLAGYLQRRGIPHEVLNAKQHFREAEIITQAGRTGVVTVATNMAGRGVDILLGGNPEGLAKRELAIEDIGPDHPDYEVRLAELTERFRPDCDEEGDRVRQLGGLYVLGTERHESRRIDDQLRGRSGRQGDPGESRFYLSLEDDLMRLFATGAMEWVMAKTLPDDVPIESRMVSKSVERAQGTVEDRNFEIRKNVLKYDEVMNEQRKVVYAIRQKVLEGKELKAEAIEAIEEALAHAIDTYCGEEHSEDWDREGLLAHVGSYFQTSLTAGQIAEIDDLEDLEKAFVDDAVAQYEAKEAQIGAEQLREVERRVMLSVLDRHWREHLYEMDYLQEGINLRAMGQKDPLTEWQREGYDMFEAMMALVADDFVKYVFHLEVVKEEGPRAPAVRNIQYSAPEDPVQGRQGVLAAVGGGAPAPQPAAVGAPAGGPLPQGPAAQAVDEAPPQPVRVEKTPGRNDPCHCGSGKKYKFCHGR